MVQVLRADAAAASLTDEANLGPSGSTLRWISAARGRIVRGVVQEIGEICATRTGSASSSRGCCGSDIGDSMPFESISGLLASTAARPPAPLESFLLKFDHSIGNPADVQQIVQRPGHVRSCRSIIGSNWAGGALAGGHMRRIWTALRIGASGLRRSPRREQGQKLVLAPSRVFRLAQSVRETQQQPFPFRFGLLAFGTPGFAIRRCPVQGDTIPSRSEMPSVGSSNRSPPESTGRALQRFNRLADAPGEYHGQVS